MVPRHATAAVLTDDVACESVLHQLHGCDLQGKVLVNHSTTTPDFASAAVQQLLSRGCTYITAPVWGRWDAGTASSILPHTERSSGAATAGNHAHCQPFD